MEKFNDLNTPSFSFNGLNCISRVVDITDGDTIKIIIIKLLLDYLILILVKLKVLISIIKI